jgi:hypothetical protein
MEVFYVSQGIYGVTLWRPMRSANEWGVIVQALRVIPGWKYGPPAVGVELTPDTGHEKTEDTAWIRFSDTKEGAPIDPVGFVVHAYGRRPGVE